MINEHDIKDMCERDPYGKSPSSPGAKLDAGKYPLFRGVLAYFPRACEQVASVSAFGASKYTWNGWETVPDGFKRYSDAMVRHLAKEGCGELEDDDSKLLHAAHTAWNSLARLELFLRQEEQIKPTKFNNPFENAKAYNRAEQE